MASKKTPKKALKKAGKRAGKLDKHLTHAAAAAHDHRVARIAGTAAEVADQPPLIALSVATAAIGLVARRPGLVRGGVRMLIAHGVATGIKTLVKHRVDRTRPKRALKDGEHQLRRGDSDDHELNSFPSGHLAGAIAVSRAAAHEIDGVALPAGVATGAVAAAQAPAGNHYFSDMVAGAVIGWVSEAVVGAVFDRVEPVVERAIKRLG